MNARTPVALVSALSSSTGSTWIAEGSSLAVASLMMTSPGRASPCSLAAMLGAAPEAAWIWCFRVERSRCQELNGVNPDWQLQL